MLNRRPIQDGTVRAYHDLRPVSSNSKQQPPSKSKTATIKTIEVGVCHFKVKAVEVGGGYGGAICVIHHRRSPDIGEVCVERKVGCFGVQAGG